MISFLIIKGEMMREPVIVPQPPSDLLAELGNQLREGRQRAGLTQDQTAMHAGLSRTSYRAIETGTAAPRAGTLVNIARALGMEMMLIPKEMVPAVQAMLHSGDYRPAFAADKDTE